MSWPKMIEPPTVTVDPDGKVIVADGEFEGASCRDAVQLGMAWAMEKIAAALAESLSADEPNLSARN